MLEAAGVPVVHGQVRFVDGETLEVEGQPHRAERYVLVTGATPTLPPIPGLIESRPWTYFEALSPDTQPRPCWSSAGEPSAWRSPKPMPDWAQR